MAGAVVSPPFRAPAMHPPDVTSEPMSFEPIIVETFAALRAHGLRLKVWCECGHAAFAAWARENPGEFYKIAARLIPAERGEQAGGVTVVIDASCGGAVQIMPTNAPAAPLLLGQE